MKIEAGKYYRTRDGRKVGPSVRRWDDNDYWDMRENDDGEGPWKLSGLNYEDEGFCSDPAGGRGDDLIAEWTDDTKHLLSNATNAQRLQESIEELNNGGGVAVGPDFFDGKSDRVLPSVPRFKINLQKGSATEDANGDWVSAQDYDALQREHVLLKARHEIAINSGLGQEYVLVFGKTLDEIYDILNERDQLRREVEEADMAIASLSNYADRAWRGEVDAGAREIRRQIDCKFSDFWKLRALKARP